ncbi:MAG: sensor histidine kinase [Candidatus Abyssobacteria bacterium SURF_17]|uniref:histidine kinase n=1 Tax=Candidatus Abyssobacteria bacterium SURF_17 TaxID=2093361 RepID=A0A419F8C4_9BACT|nr:MAG: sensor histidine kinase [Candidatus Abyssubacteria bacterium SURF_17]
MKKQTADSDRFKRTRLMILSRVLLVPFVAVMLVFGTLVYYFAGNLRGHVARELSQIADGHCRLIDQFLSGLTFQLQFVAASHNFESITRNGRLPEVLQQLQAGSHALLDLGVFDENGNHVAYVGPYDLKGKNYSQTDWFVAVREKGIYVSDVFLGYRNIPHFVIAVGRSEGGRSWYLRATVDTLYFNNLVEGIRVGKTGEAYLLNEQGIFQTTRRSGGELMEPDTDHGIYQSEADGVRSFSAESTAGGRHLYATCRLHETGWLLVVRQEIADAYAPLIRAVLIAIGIIVAGGAVVVTMGFFLASGLANQLTVAAMEKRQMGSQLIMAGKLAEVGEMSAGIAHEINNPLQVMKAEETLMMDIFKEMQADGTLPDNENVRMLRDSINQIDLQIDRCKKITQGLLRFARQSETTIQTIEIPSFMRDVVGMVERKANVENIRIVQEFEDGLPSLESDPAQLQQVFLNLFNNAIDALKGRDNGEIRVTAKQEDAMLAVAVTDNGCGIPEQNLEKVFLPFFTTKPVGRGTGLGLSTCYGIVERLGGQITVSSEVNAGSAFTVRLPLSGSRSHAETRPTTNSKGGNNA